MMDVKEIRLNDDGKVVAMKGTFRKNVFKHNSNKTYFWATFELDYMGG